jgi:hypothetical protein
LMSIYPGKPDLIRRATADHAHYSDSTVGGSRDDGPSGQPAVDGLTEQAAQPPCCQGGTPHLEGLLSRQSSAALNTATAASLALEIGDYDARPRNERVADDDIDAVAEGEG